MLKILYYITPSTKERIIESFRVTDLRKWLYDFNITNVPVFTIFDVDKADVNEEYYFIDYVPDNRTQNE